MNFKYKIKGGKDNAEMAKGGAPVTAWSAY